ncbi:HAD family hydrolase [Seongchinamella sediminis]|uniref:phosphoglycolate phosphatase n=1 Tax=Seongchinamella sediminis TaxID=2283635 RepID=A0A3L7E1S1_9GAMM|nr:HAD-IA family hydrolase [Seongchinamella sediminis]RLQ22640.1 HAD family hydrolase [Seongchinamella sediminis]
MATSAASGPLPPPRAILFDWHGTLVNTLDAMYQAIEDMLPQLEELGLIDRLVPEAQAGSREDEKLIRYIRIFRKLHPRVLAERRVSRTEIFDALFADDEGARSIAHRAYNKSYRKFYGEVYPYQKGIADYLRYLKSLDIPLGVATNRSREFFDNELYRLDNGAWRPLFSTTCCGDEAGRHKPAPDMLLHACEQLGVEAGPEVWYVGDSITDMITAKAAGITPVFYNAGLLPPPELERLFSGSDNRGGRPRAVVDDFEQLLDLLAQAAPERCDRQTRPPRLPPREPLPPHVEPDWHPAVATLAPPQLILFDWHATLVDTLDAMYHAVDDLLPELAQLGLAGRLVRPESSKSPDDQRLVDYVRERQQLHPRVKADRKISRTDIFEVLFGEDNEAKRIAHAAFNRHYRKYFGKALPFEPRVRRVLEALAALDLPLGIITNRDREFFLQELANVDGEDWSGFFDTAVCGDDTSRRKPHPDQLQQAVKDLGFTMNDSVWYVGDSTTDTIAARTAGATSVFFNGAQWDLPWLNKIFPGSARYPYKPDVVVNDFAEFWALVLACMDSHRA